MLEKDQKSSSINVISDFFDKTTIKDFATVARYCTLQ